MPFLGILEDRSLANVPGTVILEEEAAHSEDLTGALKHGEGRNAHVILVPQPSNDVNDPLNWTKAKKITIFGITCWGTVLYGAVTVAMLNPAFYSMSLDLDVPISMLVQTSGYQTLVTGICGPILAAIARKYGKRPLFLLAALFCLVGSIVGSCLPTYQGVLVARILQGFASAPFESLIYDMLSDLFFLHERGIYTALINLSLVGVSNITAVVSGPIAARLGWRWVFYLVTIFGAVQFVLQIFFVPETSYRRKKLYDIDNTTEGTLDAVVELEHETQMRSEKHGGRVAHIEHDKPEHNMSTISQEPAPPAKTFVQNLAIFTGSYSDENLLQAFIAPFAVVTNLAVAWVMVINSMFIMLYVVIAFILAQEFGPPPYLLSPSSIGLLSLGPFVGGVIGAILMATTSDPSIKWCARKNKGVYEPEYRLLPSVLGLVAAASLMGWGVMVSEGISPFVTATMHGLIVFGVLVICVASSNYAIDAFRSMTAEIFIASMTTKNILVFAFSYFVNDWTAEVGVRHAFFVWGAVAFGLAATCPFMYVFGKKYRSYWARNDLLKRWGVVVHNE